MALPAPIAQYLKKIRGTSQADEALKLLGISTTTTTKSGGKRKSAPYWMKRIERVDPLCLNGWGVQGSFLNNDTYASLPDGELVLFKFNNASMEQQLVLLQRDSTAGDVTITFPNGKTKVIPGARQLMQTGEYARLVTEISSTYIGVPTFVSPNRPKTAA